MKSHFTQTLGEFIVANQKDYPNASGEFSALFSAMRLAAKVIHREINKAGLAGLAGLAGEDNIQGEAQRKLDVLANDTFKAALSARGVVCGIASEEEDHYILLDDGLNTNSKYIVLMDPLDGSSNIDVNVSVGTIFSVYRRRSPIGTKVTDADFYQPGTEQVAAGYIIYGSSTMMVYTTGHGVNGFTFDPTLGVFCLSHPDMKTPETGAIYSVNEGNYVHFPDGVKRYIKYCQVEDKATSRPYTSRYIGSLVSDIHRNLIYGGIFLYPSSAPYPKGKLRLLYECNPIAFLVEQAGGRAIYGTGKRIMEIQPESLHERVPFFAGSSGMIEDLERCLDEFGGLG